MFSTIQNPESKVPPHVCWMALICWKDGLVSALVTEGKRYFPNRGATIRAGEAWLHTREMTTGPMPLALAYVQVLGITRVVEQERYRYMTIEWEFDDGHC